MNQERTIKSILTGTILLGAGLARFASAQSANGTWTTTLPADPEAAWLNNGLVVEAHNLGPASGSTINIQTVTVAGITFDTDLANFVTGSDGNEWGSGYIPENPAGTSYYYTGANAAVADLVNTWAWAHNWWWGDPEGNLYINYSNLVPGHNYQLQLLTGFPWDGDGVCLYGPSGEFVYFASGSGQGMNTGMATFTWTATSSSGQFYIYESYLYAEQEFLAYSLIDTSVTAAPWISSPQKLAGGKFTFTINSAANATLDVLVSHDLVNWVTAGSVTNVSGTSVYTSSSATSSPTFFRLLQ